MVFRTKRLIGRLRWLAGQLGANKALVEKAAGRAAEVQQTYENDLAKIGQRTLDYGRENRIPVVAVVGSLHVIYDRAVNPAFPICFVRTVCWFCPMDCYPIPQNINPLSRIAWEDSNRALRVAISARENGNVFPVFLSSFGCGPASFAEHFFHHLMEGYPHTALESDGHGGFAGFVTRIQAFLHTVRQHDGRPVPAGQKRINLFDTLERPPIAMEKDSKIVVFSMADQVGPITAAVFRALGFDAVPSATTSAASLAAGEGTVPGRNALRISSSGDRLGNISMTILPINAPC
jgi:hypothetical protein